MHQARETGLILLDRAPEDRPSFLERAAHQAGEVEALQDNEEDDHRQHGHPDAGVAPLQPASEVAASAATVNTVKRFASIT